MGGGDRGGGGTDSSVGFDLRFTIYDLRAGCGSEDRIRKGQCVEWGAVPF
jgi:hypothetical protein